MKPWSRVALGAAVGVAVGGLGGFLLGLCCGTGPLASHRGNLEILYFITAGPLLLLAVLAGLSQVFISVREISAKSHRDAAMLAISSCDKYTREFLPIERKAVEALAPLRLGVDEWKLLDSSFEWRAFADEKGAREWSRRVTENVAAFSPVTLTVNMLEAIAMAYVHGKADMDIGYNTIGAPFCQGVRRWAPHLVALRSQQTPAASGAFAATLTLYRAWEARRIALGA